MPSKSIITSIHGKTSIPEVPSRRGAMFLLMLLSLLIAPYALGDPALEKIANGLNIDDKEISVSGISSGAFFAHQFHVVHSEHVMGAGIVAGGPYYCAKGNVLDAITRCSKFVGIMCDKFMGRLDQEDTGCGDYFPETTEESRKMAEDSLKQARKENTLKGIGEDKIYLFSGLHDDIVPIGVMDAIDHFYQGAGVKEGNIEYNKTFPARHSMVRDSYDKPGEDAVTECAVPPASPPSTAEDTFIHDCQSQAIEERENHGCPSDDPKKQEKCADLEDVDLAGAILKHIYGDSIRQWNGRKIVDEDKEVQPFDQRKVFKGFSDDPHNELQLASMAREGYIFVPKACKNEGKECKLHIAFHGCLQGGRTDDRIGKSGNLYAKYAGYNEWAKGNNIVVLYPQVENRNMPPPLNPMGCWDWWGQAYTGENYHTREAPQMKAVAHMINILVDGNLLEVSGGR
uniref:Poly(3-hydroxybutyrate) depolymerase n=1 Tax=Candidatus Kentrum sp. LFY TaxID=2126342 RepID=A0A450WXW7_9GAMM|nr:MAG: poly(3-hydroxybutyrate) depolymerase [Candidatus Kentron sp. LFY]